MGTRTATAILFLALMGIWKPGWAMKELSESELDKVTAGTSVAMETHDSGTLHFQFHRDNGRDLSIDGDGTIALRESPLPSTMNTLILNDNAQSNLHALVNVNAVNSLLQVLINLNINVNSTVGVVHQINRTGAF
jgi:hypothetical protein